MAKTDLEARLEASLVLLTLRLQAPIHIDRLVEKTGLTRKQVAHDLLWIRISGHDVRIADEVVSLRA